MARLAATAHSRLWHKAAVRSAADFKSAIGPVADIATISTIARTKVHSNNLLRVSAIRTFGGCPAQSSRRSSLKHFETLPLRVLEFWVLEIAIASVADQPAIRRAVKLAASKMITM